MSSRGNQLRALLFVEQRQMIDDRQPWLSAPTLIHGPRKAGTTLLLRLIDTNGPVLAFPSETKFKSFQKHPRAFRREPAAAYFNVCRHTDLRHPLFDRAGYRERIQHIKESQLDLRSVIQEDAAALVASIRGREQPSTFVVKEVGGKTTSEAVVDAFRLLFPEGKLILITRDPRFVARAIYRARRRAGVRLGPLELLRHAFEPIRVGNSQRRLLARRDIPVLHVRYEDIVTDMLEQTMRRIAAFLEVPYTDEFSRPTLFGEPTVVETSSRQTTAVFREDASWADDLEPREQRAIRIAQRAGPWLYRVGRT